MNPELIESTIDPEIDILPDFIVDMLNEFTIYYNRTHNLSENTPLITEILPNATDTVHSWEEFYDAQIKYGKNETLNPDANKLHSPNEYTDNGTDELFGIKKNSELYLVSQSLFSVLIEIVNLKRETMDNTKYEIIPIRKE